MEEDDEDDDEDAAEVNGDGAEPPAKKQKT